MIRIQIEVPLDPDEWEYLGIVYPELGDTYLSDDRLSEWRYGDRCSVLYPTFRRRRNWKAEIVWPKCFKEGFVMRSESHLFWVSDLSLLTCGGAQHNIPTKGCLDLSFLPAEFWECDWKDSLVEVKHGDD